MQARESASLRDASARCCEHFCERARSAQKEAPVGKADQLFESSEDREKALLSPNLKFTEIALYRFPQCMVHTETAH